MKSIIRSAAESFGYDIVPHGSILMNTRQMRNFLYYHERYESIQNTDGAVVECGVGRGRSMLYFSYFSWSEKKGRRVWGFDSFEGFPEPAAQDASARNPKKGDWSDVEIGLIRDVLKTAGIPEEWPSKNLRLVKGFFSDTLSTYDGGPISLLHVDVDLYQSYKDVLTSLFPFVVEGGTVLFDEYNEPKWPGATQAIDEYFAKTSYRPQKDVKSGKYYLIKS